MASPESHAVPPLGSRLSARSRQCHEFSDGSGWLVTDVAIECRTPKHDRAILLACIAIVVRLS